MVCISTIQEPCRHFCYHSTVTFEGEWGMEDWVTVKAWQWREYFPHRQCMQDCMSRNRTLLITRPNRYQRTPNDKWQIKWKVKKLCQLSQEEGNVAILPAANTETEGNRLSKSLDRREQRNRYSPWPWIMQWRSVQRGLLLFKVNLSEEGWVQFVQVS